MARVAAELGDRIVHLGYVPGREEYLDRVASADIVLSTARHDFFGVAVVEAMFLGCLPVLPRALAYPEIVPERLHGELLYDPGTVVEFLAGFLRAPPRHLRDEVRAAAERFDWLHLAPELDRCIEAMVSGKAHDSGLPA
jgi:glycosyltransferase involved in cell wall biosynthesis